MAPTTVDEWSSTISTYVIKPHEPLLPYIPTCTFSGSSDGFHSFASWLSSEMQPHKAVALLSSNRDPSGQVITVEVTHALKRPDTLLRSLISSATTKSTLLNGDLISSSNTTGRDLWVQLLNKYDTMFMRSNHNNLLTPSVLALETHLSNVASRTPSALPPTASAGARYTSQAPTTPAAGKRDRWKSRLNGNKSVPWSDDVKRHWSRVREEFVKQNVDSHIGELLKGISTDTDVFSMTFMRLSSSSAHPIQAQTTQP